MEFEGDKEAAKRYLNSIAGRYYVYLLCRPNGIPFYVGKGLNRRVFEHELEAHRNHPVGETNPFKCNVIRKIFAGGGSIRYGIDSSFSVAEEQRCLEREAELILKYRRLHERGVLTNLSGGVGNATGSAPHSLQKHTATLSGIPEDNPQRAKLNKFLIGIGEVKSVCIKPVEQMARILPTTPHSQPRTPTLRCAYALIAAAIAHGLTLDHGVEIPRRIIYDGVEGIIENGVARDILKSGMAELIPNQSPIKERFRVDGSHVKIIERLYGREALILRGLL